MGGSTQPPLPTESNSQTIKPILADLNAIEILCWGKPLCQTVKTDQMRGEVPSHIHSSNAPGKMFHAAAVPMQLLHETVEATKHKVINSTHFGHHSSFRKN
ncbi:hypothetical protein MJO29_009070 [Puccinia striiformis f. sp. tritici]|nr:hypothetical protein MJO29_009070 [Puccinia striiformis f. sp. tritici]